MSISRFLHLSLSLFVIVLLSGKLQADDAAAGTETKLREALKNTMLQLRDAQNQVATLQAAKDQSDKDNADLKTQLDAANGTIKTQSEATAKDKADWDTARSDLNSQIEQKDRELATLNDSITKWKAAFAQSDSLAKATESARQKLAGQVIELQRLVSDRETKNLELFRAGNEILVRYEKFSLGEALAAKEPFVGITRTKLEMLVQGYQDKLSQGRVSPAPVTAMTTPKIQ